MAFWAAMSLKISCYLWPRLLGSVDAHTWLNKTSVRKTSSIFGSTSTAWLPMSMASAPATSRRASSPSRAASVNCFMTRRISPRWKSFSQCRWSQKFRKNKIRRSQKCLNLLKCRMKKKSKNRAQMRPKRPYLKSTSKNFRLWLMRRPSKVTREKKLGALEERRAKEKKKHKPKMVMTVPMSLKTHRLHIQVSNLWICRMRRTRWLSKLRMKIYVQWSRNFTNLPSGNRRNLQSEKALNLNASKISFSLWWTGVSKLFFIGTIFWTQERLLKLQRLRKISKMSIQESDTLTYIC